MTRELLRADIGFTLDEGALLKRLHCAKDDEIFIRALQLLETVRTLIRPSFVIKAFPLDEVKEKGVVVGGHFFRSHIIAKKLKDEKNVFAYIATCGRELGDYVERVEDMLDKHLLDELAYQVYLRAMEAMSADIENVFGIARHIRLCPGSIQDWSVSDVREIFALLGGLYQKLNVTVLDSGMITPIKSTSGFFYASDEEFSSCSLCPRAHCELRQMPFDEELHNQMNQ